MSGRTYRDVRQAVSKLDQVGAHDAPARASLTQLAVHWPRVAVVGGSLGGLTAALVLRDLGCDVRVFERSSAALEGRGAGILVLDDTIRYLVQRDGQQVVDRVCSRTSWVRYVRTDGSTRYQEQWPYRFSSWNSMYRALVRHFDADRYHFGTELVDFEQGPGAVSLRFADGSVCAYDLLVCADGIDSASRQRLLPEVVPRYAGYVAWRGTVAESQLSAGTFETLCDAITYQLLPDSHILVYPIPSLGGDVAPGRRLMNFVWYRNVAAGAELADLLIDRHGQRRSVSLPPGSVQQRFTDEVRAYAAEAMAAPIAEVVQRTLEPFVQVIFDVEVPAMAFGRVCLIGDAAFALRPHAAAGTAKAARDGWALAEALATVQGDVEAALQRWQPGQLELGRQVMTRAREIGNSSQFNATWVPGDPNLRFGLYGPAT